MSDTYHLFLSYSRLDDKKPVNAAGEGWITAFKGELRERLNASLWCLLFWCADTDFRHLSSILRK